jgi:hypothetical protein
MTGGTIRLENVIPDHFEAALRKLKNRVALCSVQPIRLPFPVPPARVR